MSDEPVGHLDDGEDFDAEDSRVDAETEERLFLAECQKAADAGL